MTKSPLDLVTDAELHSRILSNMPGHIVWKDQQSRYLCANKEAIKNLGFASLSQMHLLSHSDAPCKAAELAPTIIAGDKLCMEIDSVIQEIVAAYLAEDNFRIFIAQRQPLRNEQQDIIGISVQNLDITDTPLAKDYLWLFLENKNKSWSYKVKQGLYRYDNQTIKLNLSKRQAECLFWVLRGKTAADIASLLMLSKRTVESYIEHIKNKMGVSSKGELIAKGIELGYLNVIPAHWGAAIHKLSLVIYRS